MSDGDTVLIHCFDNVAYMARSEEGGDLPIRRYPDGSYFIEGTLVLASKERLFMFFKNCIPIFKLLEKFVVFFLSPLPRYLYSGCCTREDHAPNSLQDGYEEEMRKALMACRWFFKDFFFTSGFRNVTVLNPGMETPQEDELGLQLWGLTQSTHCRRGTAGSSTWSAGRRRRRTGQAGSGWGRPWSPRTASGPGSNPLVRDGLNRPSHRSLCSRATGEVLEETVAEAVVEAGGRGEAWAEAWATTSPN
jgi:hypothetical protein